MTSDQGSHVEWKTHSQQSRLPEALAVAPVGPNIYAQARLPVTLDRVPRTLFVALSLDHGARTKAWGQKRNSRSLIPSDSIKVFP